MRYSTIIACLIAILIPTSGLGAGISRSWSTDILGPEFQSTTIDQGRDYTGKVVSTVVRRMGDCGATRRGALYIHGFNDYFFQREMADSFAAHGMDFYAVDLRRYGRSTTDSHRQFEVRNISEYFADIDSALSVMRSAGIDSVTLIGHSTGGLTAAYYMARQPSPMVSGLILNSPFLDWNLGSMEHWVWAVDLLGAVAPRTTIPQGDSDIYSRSLLKESGGEWTYCDDWKHRTSPDVTAGWVRAIDLAQRWLHHHPDCIKVPVLLMYSAESYEGGKWSEEARHADSVLDVNDIRRYGLQLGNDVQPVKVVGGLHDLILSAPGVRAGVYRVMFSWLNAPACH